MSETPETLKAFASLDIGSGQKVDFTSLAEMQAYFRRDWTNVWVPFFDGLALNENGLSSRLFTTLRDNLRSTSKRLHRQMTGLTAEATTVQVGNALHAFQEHNNTGRGLTSLNPADSLLLGLAQTDAAAALVGAYLRMAGFNLFSLNDATGPTDIKAMMQAAARYAKASAGNDDLPKAWQVMVSLAQAREEYLTDNLHQTLEAAGRIEKQWTEQLNEARVQMDELEKYRARMASEHANMMTGYRTAHDEMEASYKVRMEGLARLFHDKLALAAPVTYWKNRARNQSRNAVLWIGGFVLLCVIVAEVLWDLRTDILALLGTGKDVNFAALPLIGIAILPALWLLKHISRQFADCMTDARDAAQRAVQAETYLALMQKAAEIDAGQRPDLSIALNALFRPGPAQPTEDGIPLPLVELFKNK